MWILCEENVKLIKILMKLGNRKLNWYCIVKQHIACLYWIGNKKKVG